MIATIAVIAAIAEKKKNFSDRSDHMKPLSSDRSDNNRWDIKSSISAIVVAAIDAEWSGTPNDRMFPNTPEVSQMVFFVL